MQKQIIKGLNSTIIFMFCGICFILIGYKLHKIQEQIDNIQTLPSASQVYDQGWEAHHREAARTLSYHNLEDKLSETYSITGTVTWFL